MEKFCDYEKWGGSLTRPDCCATINPMSDFKPRPGTFRPYMEAQKQSSKPVSPLALLEILARQPRQSLPMFDLQAQGGMEPVRYGEALKSLQDAGYITIEGDVPDQAVRLTTNGAGVVRLARPA